MHNSDSQNNFTTNPDPVFPSTTHLPTTAPKTSPSKLPLESDFQDHTERDEILSTGQSTSKRPLDLSPTKSAGLSSSNRQNAVRIKDLLEDIASTRRSIENQSSLSNQYRTLDPRANTSVEYINNNNTNNNSSSLNNSVDMSRSFNRASSANTLGYRNRANNSAFMSAYQQPSIVNMSVLQDAKRKLNNIGKITPLSREQRPQSSSGYRLNLRSETSLSPSTGKRLDRMDSSMMETDFSVRMETMPDSEYVSENARQTVVDRKEAVRHFKKQGVQKYENKVLRQELERQMKSLENRVKRLTTEENTIKKNIKKTEDTMLKAITVKQRMQEDMTQAHAARMKRFQDEQKARERIKEERMKRESTIKFKVDQMKGQKAMNANQVKTQKYEGTMKMSEDMRREDEKKQMIYQSTSGFEKIAKMKKKVKDMMSKEQMDENHIRFLQEEHMRTLEIERRIQELARKEERLIDHIKATHQIQVRAENIMKKVLTTKVELPKESEAK